MSKKLAASYTGLSTDTLDHHSIVIGDLPRFKPAGKVLYRKSDLDKWLRSYLDVKMDDSIRKNSQKKSCPSWKRKLNDLARILPALTGNGSQMSKRHLEF